MRPLLFSLSSLQLLPLATTSAAQRIISFPVLQYPVCRRNFTCSPPAFQHFPTIMADQAAEVPHLNEPASAEEAILNPNSGREEALETVAEEKKKEEKPAEPVLPKLTAAEFKVYNSMAEHMNYFHNHFRQTWTLLYTACENNQRPKSHSLKSFLTTGLQFVSHLTAHHSIEEAHIFPILARKMPEFSAATGNQAELLRQHKAIHKGMDVFGEYLEKCRSGETELELRVLKGLMDSWGEVLWKHLDQEVKTLGAENMRKYWTVEEMRRMPM